MRIYLKYIARYKLFFILGVSCVALEAVCDLLCPTVMAKIVNEGIELASVANVWRYGKLMLLVTACGAVFAVSRNIIASRLSRRFGADLRRDLFDKMLRLSEPAADKFEGASLITRMTNDVQQATQFVNGTMRIFLKAPVTCIGSIVLSTVLDPRLSIITYIVVAIVAALIVISMKLSYPRYAKLQRAIDSLNSAVQEYLIGVRLIKAFGTKAQEKDKFERANTELFSSEVAAQTIIKLFSPVMSLTVGIGSVAVIYMGAALFKLELTEPGNISAFTIYMAQILTSLLTITNIFNTIVRTKASTARINEIFAAEEDFARADEAVAAKPALIADADADAATADAISFEDVSFAYPTGSGERVLEGISFTLGRGESLAVIGPTGSGKSTLAYLLMRFYDVNGGAIRLFGRDVRELDIEAVRTSVAIAPQKPMLFSGTVAENLRFGNGDATDGDLRAALERAAAEFVYQMPEGLSSRLGSNGVNISGGQKQRLSIARALVKNAPILVLDDATSALDAVTEARVRRTLMGSGHPYALIMITQRCSSAMGADNILVLDEGRAVGYGSHAELMKTCLAYRELYRSQIEGESEEANG